MGGRIRRGAARRSAGWSVRAGIVLGALVLAALAAAEAARGEDGGEVHVPAPVVERLYEDFVRSGGEASIALALTRAMAERSAGEAGPLVLVVSEGVFVYGRDRALIAAAPVREDVSDGGVELTAISHVGPAVAYLASLAELGAPWRSHAARLVENLRGFREMNADGRWMDGVTSRAFDGRREAIRAMLDYAASAAGRYLADKLSGPDEAFTLEDVKTVFFDGGTAAYPVGYDAVMVGTFALATLSDADWTARALAAAPIDWAGARVVVNQRIGTNYGAGLTAGTNWMVDLLLRLSAGALPPASVLIVPYAERHAAVGEDPLPQAAFTYYDERVWQALTERTRVAEAALASIPAIAPETPRPLPGDWAVSEAGDVADFMMRLKHTFASPAQLLSNATGFWIAGALAEAGWAPSGVTVPGLEAGLPPGLDGYPTDSPPIPPLGPQPSGG